MARKTLFTLLLFMFMVSSALGTHEKVKITDVKALTLKKNAMTTGRRVAAVPQLQCRGNLCTYTPETIQCVNVGSNGSNIQWKCEADLPETIKLRDIDVNCEGYEHPQDPYILKGGCSLTYTLAGYAPSNLNDDARYRDCCIMIVGVIILFGCACNGNHRSGGRYGGYGGGGYWGAGLGSTAAAAALGAAAGSSFGGGYRRRRGGGGRSRGWGSSSRTTRTRTSTAHGGTSLR